MIRYFCDRCSAEIVGDANAVTKRITARHGRVMCEIQVAVDGTWNKGHVCAPCVYEVVHLAREDAVDD